MRNKGFSLVELIIVVAIMAVLVGVMAPQLIKYVERTNVSSDVQLCDSMREAIIISMSDPDILAANDQSGMQINYLTSGTAYKASYFTDDTEFTRSVCEIMGVDAVGSNCLTETRKVMKSTPARSSGEIYVQMNGGTVYVWIDHSDMSGKKNDNTCNTYTAVESSGVIYAR